MIATRHTRVKAFEPCKREREEEREKERDRIYKTIKQEPSTRSSLYKEKK